jgi:hypothetical protein
VIPNGERRDSERSCGGGTAMAAAAADGDDLPGASAVIGGGGGDDDGRRGQTQTGKGRRAQRRRHARADADGQGTRAALHEARFYNLLGEVSVLLSTCGGISLNKKKTHTHKIDEGKMARSIFYFENKSIF